MGLTLPFDIYVYHPLMWLYLLTLPELLSFTWKERTAK